MRIPRVHGRQRLSFGERMATNVRETAGRTSGPLEQLISRWNEEALFLRGPCKVATVQAFEDKERVVLPADFRSYWLTIDGMPETLGQSQDDNGFCFWPIHRVVRADVELRRQSPSAQVGPESSSYYIFADYLDWSWAYAIKLRPPEVGRVVTVGTLFEHVVAPSFGQFLQAYLCDGSALYPSRR
jgi:hypothetical protein